MNRIRTNFRGVEVFDGNGDPFPSGVYKFVIEDAAPGTSQSGNPTVRIRSRCIGALAGGEAQRFVGRC